MSVYIEYLTFRSLLSILWEGLLLYFIGNKEIKTHYFIDATLFGEKIANIFGRIYGCEFKKLKFRMMDIKDDNGELVMLRIPREDLISIQKEIINNDVYRKLRHNSWGKDRVESYLQKGLIDGSIRYNHTVSRIIFIINVVSWHMEKFHYQEANFIINKRPWFKVYQKYAAKFRINLIPGEKRIPCRDDTTYPLFLKIKNGAMKIIQQNVKLFILAYNIKKGKCISSRKSNLIADPLLYLEGRGDVNIRNDGNHSDLFWVLNSNFTPKYILYDYHSETEKKLLKEFGLQLNERKIIYSPESNVKLQINNAGEYKEEKKEIKSLLSSYHTTRSHWESFFHTNNVKIFFTWFKYSKDHISIADAIQGNGGISVFWQMAFNGSVSAHSQTFADIIFSYSNSSNTLEEKINSQYGYNIIIGYPKDYAGLLLKNEASSLRNKLKRHGAQKIIFSIDEYSSDDSRWHTGHELQRENYSYILEKVLEIPWLGAIFKPKVSKDLRQRLGEVNEILVQAEKTGRCKVIEDSGRHTTLASPILAGLASDVCIHGHLSAGTSAVECALGGLPTLLIDREGCPKSELYKLPEEKVIFKNWPDAMDAVMDHFQTPRGIPGFGDWSDYLDEFDPFRDGKAAYRMGTYLHWLIQGFAQGLDREIIMADAAERYAKEWGSGRVIVA